MSTVDSYTRWPLQCSAVLTVIVVDIVMFIFTEVKMNKYFSYI